MLVSFLSIFFAKLTNLAIAIALFDAPCAIEKLGYVGVLDFATVDKDGAPQVRNISAIHFEGTDIYFLTARGKSFARQLYADGRVQILGYTRYKETIRVSGKAGEVPDIMKKYYGTRMLTIYDDAKKVLYYGPRTAELNDARGIWNNYRAAAEFQESWVNQNGTVICNLPLEKVVPGN